MSRSARQVPRRPPTRGQVTSSAVRRRTFRAAFFGCLYAALRPKEAVALRHDDLILPARGRTTIILTAACPRTGSAWSSTGTPFEPRGLKHRPGGAIRVVPIPPVLVCMLGQHLHAFGTAPDGRLFRGTRGGMLSESVYGRTWHAARQAALGPTAHGHRARPARNTACRRPLPLVFPQLRQHLRRDPQRPGDARIRPTHSPRNKADGPHNRSLSRLKPVTPSGVTGSDLGLYVAGVGFEPT